MELAPQPEMRRAWLSVTKKHQPGVFPDIEIVLHQGEMVVGRHCSAQVYLEHRSISRRHSVFLHRENNLHVMDLGSSHGTVVNCERIRPHIPVLLKPGDKLKFGESKRIYTVWIDYKCPNPAFKTRNLHGSIDPSLLQNEAQPIVTFECLDRHTGLALGIFTSPDPPPPRTVTGPSVGEMRTEFKRAFEVERALVSRGSKDEAKKSFNHLPVKNLPMEARYDSWGKTTWRVPDAGRFQALRDPRRPGGPGAPWLSHGDAAHPLQYVPTHPGPPEIEVSHHYHRDDKPPPESFIEFTWQRP